MRYSLDIEISAHSIWDKSEVCRDFGQGEGSPEKQALAILKERPDVISVAARDRKGKLVQIFDWRDLEASANA